MFVTIILWSGFFISLKGGANSELTSADIALARFLLPTILLLPVVINARHQIKKVPIKYLIGIFIGSGLPYLLVASHAMQYAPVAHASALIPGTLPLFVTGIAITCYKQPSGLHRRVGLILISFGIVLFLFNSLATSNNSLFTGQLMFLGASFMWALFTISARVAGLPPLVCAGLVACISTLCLFAAIASQLLNSSLISSNIVHWPWQEVIGHILLQGIGAGLLASFTYLYAIKQLGAERCAAFAASTPIVAALLAFAVFSEKLDVVTTLALLAVCLGSIVASTILEKKQPSNRLSVSN
ncbi:DMT family transporter [Vibrio sp. 99-8-1]|nr:DMT family transporter [Vibrio sp. 99-8-1]